MKIQDKFEELLTALHKMNYKITSDVYNEDNVRVVQLRKYTIYLNLYLSDEISFDTYAYLTDGIYEVGDLNLLTNRILDTIKLCTRYNARNMNTTERLYPADRRGNNTRTSGL